MKNTTRYYPPEVFHVNEDVTRRNMRAYDREQERIDRECRKLNPDYDKLHLVEQAAIRSFVMGDKDTIALRLVAQKSGVEISEITEDILRNLGKGE